MTIAGIAPEVWQGVSQTWAAFAAHAPGCMCESTYRWYLSIDVDRSRKPDRRAQLSRLCDEGRPLFESWLDFVAAAVESRYRGRRSA